MQSILTDCYKIGNENLALAKTLIQSLKFLIILISYKRRFETKMNPHSKIIFTFLVLPFIMQCSIRNPIQAIGEKADNLFLGKEINYRYLEKKGFSYNEECSCFWKFESFTKPQNKISYTTSKFLYAKINLSNFKNSNFMIDSMSICYVYNPENNIESKLNQLRKLKEEVKEKINLNVEHATIYDSTNFVSITIISQVHN